MVGFLWPRSSWATKGIDVKAGVIDAEYRGETQVLLQSDNDYQVHFNTEKPIAQILFTPVANPMVKAVQQKELSETRRGEHGFGSTDGSTTGGLASSRVCTPAKNSQSVAKIVRPQSEQMTDLKRGGGYSDDRKVGKRTLRTSQLFSEVLTHSASQEPKSDGHIPGTL